MQKSWLWKWEGGPVHEATCTFLHLEDVQQRELEQKQTLTRLSVQHGGHSPDASWMSRGRRWTSSSTGQFVVRSAPICHLRRINSSVVSLHEKIRLNWKYPRLISRNWTPTWRREYFCTFQHFHDVFHSETHRIMFLYGLLLFNVNLFQIKRLTGDILQNLTSYNISDYLVKTYSQILKKRYSGRSVSYSIGHFWRRKKKSSYKKSN